MLKIGPDLDIGMVRAARLFGGVAIKLILLLTVLSGELQAVTAVWSTAAFGLWFPFPWGQTHVDTASQASEHRIVRLRYNFSAVVPGREALGSFG